MTVVWRLTARELFLRALAGLLLAALLSQAVLASSDLPPALLKIQEYNQQLAESMLLKISFFVAFIAGVLTLLSPCILPLLPAYFSYTFKEKRDITRMTLLFFLGFTVVFMSFGFAAGLVGEQSLAYLQRPLVVVIAGIFLVVMGLLAFFDRGFTSFIRLRHKPRSDTFGVFLEGLLFAIGWTACVGPILGGILSIAALLGKGPLAALMMAFYSFGLFVPLFILSMSYDRLGLGQKSFLKPRPFTLSLLGKSYRTNSHSMIAGSLLMLIGMVFVVFRGTGVINRLGWTPQHFYAVQRWLLGWQYAHAAGTISLVLFVLVLGLFLVRSKRSRHAGEGARGGGKHSGT